MLTMNRRPGYNIQSQGRPAHAEINEPHTDEAAAFVIDILKQLSQDMNDLKQEVAHIREGLEKLESKVENLSMVKSRLDKFIEKQSAKNEALDADIQKLESEINTIQRFRESIKPVVPYREIPVTFPNCAAPVQEPEPLTALQVREQAPVQESMKPIMTGSGFSGITAEYLRSLGNRKP